VISFTCRIDDHAVAAGVGEVVLFFGMRPSTELEPLGAPGEPYLKQNKKKKSMKIAQTAYYRSFCLLYWRGGWLITILHGIMRTSWSLYIILCGWQV
jgi:hypothetical protein